MKYLRRQQIIVLVSLLSAGGLAAAGFRLRPWFTVGRIRPEGVTSYYVYSGTGPDHRGKLPVIILIGHPLSRPSQDLSTLKNQSDEPVLLVWSGLMTGLPLDCPVDNEAVWAEKRQQFLKLLDDYKKKLNIDTDRIYLTGFSAAGVHAWMLAYDRPELYAAVVPMSAPSYPRQIQEHLEAGRAVVTVWVRGEKDDTPPRDLAAEKRTGRIVESYNPRSRFVLKPGEGHRDMHKYWRENLQYVLQFRKRDDNEKMTKNSGDTARSSSEAFLAWARRAAIPMPASPEEPLGAEAQVKLDRMLGGKRFVYLGEPEHCIVEKYLFRLTLIRYLFAHGWCHAVMEAGRSIGWRVDRYLETGDVSCLDAGLEPPDSRDVAIHGKTVEFIDKHESPFYEQLRRISAHRAPDTPRLHYSGYDLDLGMPLGAVEPIRHLLEGYTDRRVQELLDSINTLAGLSVEEQLTLIEALQNRVTTCEDVLPGDVLGELRSWLSFLHDSVAAEKRPRMTQDRRGHHLWRGRREHTMMQYLDAIVDALGDDGKLILMGHSGHLSKDASGLRFRPQLTRFWGWRSWLRALAYEAFSRLTRCPLDIGTQDGSVGSHLHERFPGQVLSIWMLYGQGTLMMPGGPRTMRLHNDTIESLLARVGDRFLLPLNDVDPQAKAILSNANLRTSWGYYASADLTTQADAIYFVRDVNAD
jgi:erythromycin esterase-like protein/dienelactone hydrolase